MRPGPPEPTFPPHPLPGASPSGCASQIACTHDFISRLRILCSCSGKTCWMTPRAASSGTAPRVGGEAGTVPRVPPAWSGLGRRDSGRGGSVPRADPTPNPGDSTVCLLCPRSSPCAAGMGTPAGIGTPRGQRDVLPWHSRDAGRWVSRGSGAVRLCHTVPCCAVLCHTVPCCAMLCCAILCCAVLCRAVPYCAVLCHTH